jgi:hypothetical protein
MLDVVESSIDALAEVVSVVDDSEIRQDCAFLKNYLQTGT